MLDVDINNTVSGNAKKSLQTILDAMELKSKTLRSLEISTEEDARKLFESVFYARKHFSDVISKTSIPELSYAFSQLKDPSLSYSERVEKFKSTVKGGEREDIEDMAKEIIHFLEPEKYPLWTRWIWNKERGTGSINYVIKDDVKINDEKELFSTIDELRNVLEIFGLESKGKYYITSVFLVYAYVRYLDYTTHLAVDKKAAGLIPTHLSTTALVLGLKPYLKVIKLANT
ncbi:hypothetical protein D1867_11560 [Acidianus infernus]|uniref:Uncharacterized protein n=2 Tax=Acidianus TaxID=12914 RepID=A0A6A9QPN9_ACIIN|nr:hypothetical protein [Acidianus infernus]MCY0874512.1 hypothetical protein [Acidianus infernus]MUM65858.1 hypothetical protein [Acidianus infernus]